MLLYNFSKLNFLKRRQDEDKTRQDKSMVKHGFFQNLLFWTYIKKICTFTFWSFLLVHNWFTPSQGRIDFVNWFIMKYDHESWTIKSDYEKCHLPCFNFIIHGVNQPLYTKLIKDLDNDFGPIIQRNNTIKVKHSKFYTKCLALNIF